VLVPHQRTCALSSPQERLGSTIQVMVISTGMLTTAGRFHWSADAVEQGPSQRRLVLIVPWVRVTPPAASASLATEN